MSEEKPKSSGGCLKAALIGCGLLAVLALGALVLAWDRLQPLVQKGQAAIAETSAVRDALQVEHPDAEIAVNVAFETDHEGAILKVLLADRDFLADRSREELQPIAERAAETARGAMTGAFEFTAIDVEIRSSVGSTVSVFRSEKFRFPVEPPAAEKR